MCSPLTTMTAFGVMEPSTGLRSRPQRIAVTPSARAGAKDSTSRQASVTAAKRFGIRMLVMVDSRLRRSLQMKRERQAIAEECLLAKTACSRESLHRLARLIVIVEDYFRHGQNTAGFQRAEYFL